MCGRYTDTRRDKQFLVRMGIEQAEIDFVPRYNLAPTQTASVVALSEAGQPELRRSRWGLIPFWAKDEKIGSSLVNARAESVATKPAFRTSFRRKRCLVLADGFFEWQKLPGGKQPMYLRLREGRPFAFGGLWDRWNDLETFTIITVEPNDVARPIHDRMPLILREEDIPRWLDPGTPVEQVTRLLQPYPAPEMEAFSVGTVVNSAKFDSPECIQRVEPGSFQRLVLVKPSETAPEDEPLLPGL